MDTGLCMQIGDFVINMYADSITLAELQRMKATLENAGLVRSTADATLNPAVDPADMAIWVTEFDVGTGVWVDAGGEVTKYKHEQDGCILLFADRRTAAFEMQLYCDAEYKVPLAGEPLRRLVEMYAAGARAGSANASGANAAGARAGSANA